MSPVLGQTTGCSVLICVLKVLSSLAVIGPSKLSTDIWAEENVAPSSTAPVANNERSFMGFAGVSFVRYSQRRQRKNDRGGGTSNRTPVGARGVAPQMGGPLNW